MPVSTPLLNHALPNTKQKKETSQKRHKQRQKVEMLKVWCIGKSLFQKYTHIKSWDGVCVCVRACMRVCV